MCVALTLALKRQWLKYIRIASGPALRTSSKFTENIKRLPPEQDPARPPPALLRLIQACKAAQLLKLTNINRRIIMKQKLNSRLKYFGWAIRHDSEKIKTNIFLETHHSFQEFRMFFGIVTV